MPFSSNCNNLPPSFLPTNRSFQDVLDSLEVDGVKLAQH